MLEQINRVTNSDTTLDQVTPADSPAARPTTAITISVEAIVYLGLAAFVLLLYLLRLGDVPLTGPEVPRALAAWQAVTPSAEPTVLADTVLLQMAHMFAITAFGTSEAAIRVPTALAAFLVVFSPLLFRDVLGRVRTLSAVVLLACSPVLLAAARLDSPVVWQMLAGLLTLWSIKRFAQQRTVTNSIIATVLFVSTLLLTGPTGHVVGIILLVAMGAALRIHSLSSENLAAEVLKQWAWLPGLSFAALAVVVVATGLMFYPSGINAVAQAIGGGLTGWVRPVPETPLFFALFASLFYEPILWLFGVIGAVLLVRRELTLLDAFLLAWAVVAVIAALLYQGGLAANALWITLPLVGLASAAVEAAFANETGTLWYQEEAGDTNVFGFVVPFWARWVVAAAAAIIFSLVLMHFGWLARALSTANFSAERSVLFAEVGAPAFFFVIMLLLLVLGGFTAASLYGTGTTLRGGAVGLLSVGLLASLGSGWQITTARADDPRELWHSPIAHGEEAFMLRQTLVELARRETEGFPQLEIVVVTDGQNIQDDQMVAWLLRDFENAQFVADAPVTQSNQVLLLPQAEEAPELRGNYVGQSFTLARTWDLDQITLRSAPTWWFQRQTQASAQPAQEVVLWLRQDVYDGVASDEPR